MNSAATAVVGAPTGEGGAFSRRQRSTLRKRGLTWTTPALAQQMPAVAKAALPVASAPPAPLRLGSREALDHERRANETLKLAIKNNYLKKHFFDVGTCAHENKKRRIEPSAPPIIGADSFRGAVPWIPLAAACAPTHASHIETLMASRARAARAMELNPVAFGMLYPPLPPS